MYHYVSCGYNILETSSYRRESVNNMYVKLRELGTTPESQSRECWFQSSLLSSRSLGVLVISTIPSSLSCINEYPAIDIVGNM